MMKAMNYKLFFAVATALMGVQRMQAQELTIDSDAKYEEFANSVNSGTSYEGRTVRLKADVSTSKSVGTEQHPFKGSFVGDGHVLTVNINGAEAPFAYVSGASFTTLKVKGTVKGPIHSAGLIGYTLSGTNTVTDCRISTSVTTGKTDRDGSHGGGIIGHGRSATNIVKGCLFDGKVTGETTDKGSVGAIIGWCQSATTMTIEDCVEMGTYSGFKFFDLIDKYETKTTAKIVSSWRNHDTDKLNCWSQGNRMRLITTIANDYITIDFGKNSRKYPTSSIAYFENCDGITAAQRVYACKGQTVKFQMNSVLKYHNIERPSERGELMQKNSDDKYSVTINEDRDYKFGAMVYNPDYTLKGTGTMDDPFLIETNLDWNLLCHNVDTGKSYEGQFIRLEGDVKTCYMLGSETAPFSGTFDGNGDVRRLSFEIVTSQSWIAPFRYIKGAHIQRVRVVGRTEVSGTHAGGLVANASGQGNTVSNCLVSCTMHSNTAGEGSHGGVVAATDNDNSQLVVTACMFNGNMQTGKNTTGWGGIVGWAKGTVEVKNSLFAPQYSDDLRTLTSSANFVRNGNAQQIVEHSNYYTYNLGDNIQGQNVSGSNQAWLVQLLGVYMWEQDYDQHGIVKPIMGHRTFVENAYKSADLQGVIGQKAAVNLHFGEALHNDGYFNTICLPFNMHITNSIFNEGGRLYQFSKTEQQNGKTVLVFTRMFSIVAGQPYMIRWNDPRTYFERDATWFTGVTITDTKALTVSHDGYTFCGTFDPISHKQASDEHLYVLGDQNTWHPAKSSQSTDMLLGAFRAYLKLPEGAKAANISFAFDDEDDQTTGIVGIQGVAEETSGADVWYSLDGRQLPAKPAERGVYVVKSGSLVRKIAVN